MHDYVDNTADDLEFIEQVLADIRSEYSAYSPSSLQVPYREFALLKGYIKIRELQQVNFLKGRGKVYASFLQVDFPVNPGRHGSGFENHLQAYVIVELPDDFGQIFIKKETLVEKLSELFQPVELDFADDADISRQYYVLAKDREKAIQFLNKQMRAILLQQEYRDFNLEIYEKHLLIGDKKGPAEQSMIDLLKLGHAIADTAHIKQSG